MKPSIRTKLVAFTAPAVLAASMIVASAPAAHAGVPNCVAAVRKTADVVATHLLTKPTGTNITDLTKIYVAGPIATVGTYCP